MEVKQCVKCKKIKPYDDFYADWCHCCIQCTKQEKEILKLLNNDCSTYNYYVWFNQIRN